MDVDCKTFLIKGMLILLENKENHSKKCKNKEEVPFLNLLKMMKAIAIVR